MLAINGIAGALVFWALAARRGERVLSREALRGMVLLRTLAEAGAAMLYIVALALVPLTLVSALLQASPLVVVAGAALFLRERVGWRRWLSVLAGFAGVLVILKPWDAGFQPLGLLVVGCVIVLAVRDLATRVMPARLGTFQVSAWAYAGTVPAGLALMALMGQDVVTPEPRQWLWLLAALVASSWASGPRGPPFWGRPSSWGPGFTPLPAKGPANVFPLIPNAAKRAGESTPFCVGRPP